MLLSGTPAVLEEFIHSSAREESEREEEGVSLELCEFSSLYREYSPFIYSVLRRLRVPESAVDDALQEVFLVAYRRRKSFQEGASMRSWLYGITIRVARAKNRKAAFRRFFLFPLRDEDVFANEPGEDQVEKKEAIALVDELLNHMPSKQREVFVMAELEGLTAQEIAPVLRCNVNTVYSRLRLARQRFEAAAARKRAEEQRARS